MLGLLFYGQICVNSASYGFHARRSTKNRANSRHLNRVSMADQNSPAKRAAGMSCAQGSCGRTFPGRPSEDAMVLIKNILVATDFSEPSGVALAYGRDLARNYNARLHVLHVVEDVMLRFSPEVGLIGDDLQRDLDAVASRDLNALVTDDDRRTLEAVAVIERGINPAETIIKYAKANSIDLIVTGTHGRGAVKHFLMGSVAERVVRRAPCPALTVHAHERDFIVPDALTLAASA